MGGRSGCRIPLYVNGVEELTELLACMYQLYIRAVSLRHVAAFLIVPLLLGVLVALPLAWTSWMIVGSLTTYLLVLGDVWSVALLLASTTLAIPAAIVNLVLTTVEAVYHMNRHTVALAEFTGRRAVLGLIVSTSAIGARLAIVLAIMVAFMHVTVHRASYPYEYTIGLILAASLAALAVSKYQANGWRRTNCVKELERYSLAMPSPKNSESERQSNTTMSGRSDEDKKQENSKLRRQCILPCKVYALTYYSTPLVAAAVPLLLWVGANLLGYAVLIDLPAAIAYTTPSLSLVALTAAEARVLGRSVCYITRWFLRPRS